MPYRDPADVPDAEETQTKEAALNEVLRAVRPLSYEDTRDILRAVAAFHCIDVSDDDDEEEE